jgi:hypothetical protein
MDVIDPSEPLPWVKILPLVAIVVLVIVILVWMSRPNVENLEDAPNRLMILAQDPLNDDCPKLTKHSATLAQALSELLPERSEQIADLRKLPLTQQMAGYAEMVDEMNDRDITSAIVANTVAKMDPCPCRRCD